MARQNRDPQVALREGAIYEDKAKNVVRLVSVDSQYCAYVVLTNRRSQMHGVVTGFAQRSLFQNTFSWVATSEADWLNKPRPEAGKDGEPVKIQSPGPGTHRAA
jgi:hypothetical protein